MKYIKLISFCLLFFIYTNNTLFQTTFTTNNLSIENRPRLAINLAHSSIITSIAFNLKGDLAISGGFENIVKLWSVSSGRVLQKFIGHTSVINALAFHPNGRFIISASGDSTIRLWDIETGKTIKIFKNENDSQVSSIAISSDGKYILSGGWDHNIVIWDITNGTVLKKCGQHEDWVTAVGFSPDGSKVLSGSLKEWRVWDIKNCTSILRVSYPKFQWGAAGMHARPYATPVAFHPDGKHVVSGAWDGSLGIWDISNGVRVKSFPKSKGEISAISINSTGELIASVGADRILHIWNIKTESEVKQILSDGLWSTAVAFSTNDDNILTAGVDKTIRLWNRHKGEEIMQFGTHLPHPKTIAFSADGNHLVSTEAPAEIYLKNNELKIQENSVMLRKWNLSNGKEPEIIRAKEQSDQAIALNSDGKLAIISKKNRQLALIDTETGNEINKFQGFQGFQDQVYSAVFSPNNKRIILDSDYHGTRILSIPDFIKESFLNRYPDYAKFAISDDEKILVTSEREGGSLIISEIENTNKITVKLGIDTYLGISYLSFTPDSKKIVVITIGGEVFILDAKGILLSKWKIKQAKSSVGTEIAVALSKDGEYIVISSVEDYGLHLRDLNNGNLLKEFHGHTDAINSIAFHPNGKLIASASDDKTIKIWRQQDGKELVTLISKSNGEWFVTDPEGRFDASDLENTEELHWVIPTYPNNAIPIESFMKDYYEPRLLSRILSGETLKPVRAITTIKLTQPKVEIANIEFNGIDPSKVLVTVKATPTQRQFLKQGKPTLEQTDVNDIRLFRDGQLVGYVDGVVARYGGKPFEHTFTVRIAKSNKESSPVFSAYAFNDDRVKSASVKHTFKLPRILDKSSIQKGNAYLITMGVNNHENSDWNLKFAANDAIALNKFVTQSLIETEKYDSVININLISNINENNATKMAMQAVLNRLSGKMEDVSSKNLLSKIINANLLKPANPDDTIIISFSGHGYASSNGNFYMITQNTGFGKGKVLTTDLNKLSISSEDISNWIRDIDAGDISMIIDACQSEASIQKDGFKPGPMGNKGLGQLSFDKGMRILAASQNDQVALENNKLKHGLLSYSLVADGLTNFHADHDTKDGQITLDEWFRYGLNRVPKLKEELLTGTFKEKGSEWSYRPFEEEGINSSGTTILRKITNVVQQPALFDFSKSLRMKKILASKNTSQ